jgi:MFS family permease
MKTFTFKEKIRHLFCLPVIVAALGYFVDIYDLLLFGIVRVPSLTSMGIEPDSAGILIFNWQMFGLVLGGILWGVLGDKKGRLSVLFGSIIVYSLANIACGFLPQIDFMDKTTAYAALRFIAGIGLAGELGAGITLVAESLPKELRAIGTSLVAGFGLLGAVAAYLTFEVTKEWTTAYFIGGSMGILLLIFRIGVVESGIFKEIEHKKMISKGNFFSLFTSKDRFVRYMKCIAIGLPTWFCIGILATLANKFNGPLGIKGQPLSPGLAIMWSFIGISAGDFMSGFISQWLRSRKKAIVLMMLFTLIGVILMLFGNVKTAQTYYFYCVWLGVGTGYWAMFVTVGAEQFGTNLRSTATTTIPNMVRGMVIPMTLLFNAAILPLHNVIYAAALVGAIAFSLGLYCTLTISESHDKDLDFIE